jgi:hypothetical protein
LFFASCRTRLHRISQPVPSTKVESKNPQTHPGNIIAKRNRNKTYIRSVTANIGWYVVSEIWHHFWELP